MPLAASAQNYLLPQTKADNNVDYSVNQTGVQRHVEWGLDAAWVSEGNMRRGIAWMDTSTVGIVRISYQPTHALQSDGTLTNNQRDSLDIRLRLADWVSDHVDLMLNDDPISVDPAIKGKEAKWVEVIKASVDYIHKNSKHKVVSIAPFNEPDFGWGQDDVETFNRIDKRMKSDSFFDGIRICGGNTLNNDMAEWWYSRLKNNLDEGNTHQLAGSFDTYANFFATVAKDGKHVTADELHNVGDAQVAVQYGMQTGIWWGTAEKARGEFCKATNGGWQLGYAENRGNWTSASVYRKPNGNVLAFLGSSERQAYKTTFQFVSTDQPVYYNGYGPLREYAVTIPGGTGYQNGQSNAEAVVDVTYGEDVRPVVNGTYKLMNKQSHLVMRPANASTSSGAKIEQYKDMNALADHSYQNWKFTPVRSNIGDDFSFYTIVNQKTNKSIDVLNWSLDNEGGIIQYDAAGGNNQQWCVEYAGDNYFYIRNRHSGLYLQIERETATPTLGLAVVQHQFTGKDIQKWRFLPVDVAYEDKVAQAPVNLVADGGAESIHLSWSRGSYIANSVYEVLRADEEDGNYNTIARNISSKDILQKQVEFVDNDVETGKTYYYKVRGVTPYLNRSECSAVASASTNGRNTQLAHWKLDGDLTDDTPNLNNAAVYGTASYTTGHSGKALQLNGTDNYVQLPYGITGKDALTFSAWVNWSGGNNWQRIFDFGCGTENYMFLSPECGTGMRFAIKNGADEQQITAKALTSGTWHHVALTIGTDGAILYVDGSQVGKNANVTIKPNDFKPFLNYIGRSQFAGDPTLKGSIDDVRLFNYALTVDDVDDLYNGTITGIKQTTAGGKPTVEVFDVNGKKVAGADVDQLPSGIYIIKTTNGAKTESRKIVVK